MAEQIAYSITIGGVDREIKTMQDLKKAIKDANNELLQAGPVGSQSYAEAQKKVTELKDKLGDLGDAAKVQGTAMEKLQSSTGLLGEGFRNLDLDKIKLGFQGIGSAMKAIPFFLLIEGVRLLIENFDKVVEFGQKLFNIVDTNKKNLEVSQEAYDIEKKKLEALNNQDNILKLQGKSEKEILQYKIEQLDKTIVAGKAALKAKEIELKAEEDLSIKRNEAIKTGLNITMEFSSIALRALAAPLDLVILGINKVRKALGKEELPLINEKLTEFRNKISETVASMFTDPEKIKKDNQKILQENKDALLALENQRAGHQISLNNIDKKAGINSKELKDKQLKEQQEHNDELARLRAENIKDAKQKELALLELNSSINKRNHIEKKASNEILNELDIKYQNDRQLIIEKYNKIDEENQKKLDAEKLAAQQNANQKALAEEQAFNELQILNTEEGTAEHLQAQIDLIESNASKELSLTNKTEGEKLLIKKRAQIAIDKLNEDFADKERKRKFKEVQDSLQLASISNRGLSDLSTVLFNTKLNHTKKGSEEEQKVLKQQFEANKAFQIANAIINGATGVTAVLAAKTNKEDPTGIVMALQIASVVASTAAQISTIERTRFEGGVPSAETPSMGGGGASAPTATPSMPQTRTEQGTFLNEQGQTTGRIDTRVYVLESDITNTQRDVNRVKTQSKV